MPRVVVPVHKPLPPVCVLTGTTEDIVFMAVPMSYDDRDGSSKMIQQAAMTRRKRRADAAAHVREFTVPFSRTAYDRWKAGEEKVRRAPAIAFAVVVVMAALGMYVLLKPQLAGDSETLKSVQQWVAGGLCLGSPLVALVIVLLAKRARPFGVGKICLAAGRGKALLDVPSVEAANAINAHFQALAAERKRRREAREESQETDSDEDEDSDDGGDAPVEEQ